jgi:hypothetical protein
LDVSVIQKGHNVAYPKVNFKLGTQTLQEQLDEHGAAASLEVFFDFATTQRDMLQIWVEGSDSEVTEIEIVGPDYKRTQNEETRADHQSLNLTETPPKKRVDSILADEQQPPVRDGTPESERLGFRPCSVPSGRTTLDGVDEATWKCTIASERARRDQNHGR